MSVRNQYARNYSKVTPFPPSNKLISEAKKAARKANYSRPLSDKKAKPDNELYQTMKREATREVIGKRALTEMTKTSKSPHVNKDHDEQTNEFVNNDNLECKNVSEFRRENIASPYTKDACDILYVWGGETDTHDDIIPQATHNQQYTHTSSTVETNSTKAPRPKSARPESRWERRKEDHSFETSENEQNKPLRPKSARPESRMLRLMEARAEGKFNDKDELPPRPVTSYGRRRSTGTDNEINVSVIERPKSRIGNYTNEADGNESQSRKRDQKTSQHKKSGRAKNAKHVWQQGEDLYAQPAQGKYTTWRSKTVLDLNSGIDDIDLDVDPVLYFMQSDNLPPKAAVASNSLSKDTIEFIGNADNQRRSKVPISYHGNNLDNHASETGKSSRFYGSRVNSVPTLIRDKNISRTEERLRFGKGDQFYADSIRPPFSEDVSCVKSKPDNLKYLKSNRSRAIINECRGQHSPEYFQNGRYMRQTEVSGDSRTGLAYRRHPRRLQPITSAFNDNT